MAAPTSKTACASQSGTFDTPLSGHVHQPPRAVYEGAKVAPTLHSFVRKTLEARKVQAEDIETFLKEKKTLQRYDSAFRLLWALCFFRGEKPAQATIQEVPGHILYLNTFSQAHARNAYSGLLIIPGWDQLQYSCAVQEALEHVRSEVSHRLGGGDCVEETVRKN